MALIKCPDCSREVSDRAPACPQCGGPIASATGAGIAVAAPRGVQAIEATGKDYKAAMFFGVLAIIVGTPLFAWASMIKVFEVQIIGAVLAIVGFAAYLFGRLGGWWNHG